MQKLPLRGFLKCRICGGNLTGSAAKGNGGQYYYYHCQKDRAERFPAKLANTQFIKYLDSIKRDPSMIDLYMEIVDDMLARMETDRSQQRSSAERQLARATELIEAAADKFVQGALERNDYELVKRKYEGQRAKAQAKIYEQRKPQPGIRSYAEFMFTLLSDIAKYYSSVSVELKQQLLGLILDDKLIFDGGKYRTVKVKPVFELLLERNRPKGKGPIDDDDDRSYLRSASRTRTYNPSVNSRMLYH